jgi:hypothetical protein
MIELDEVNSPSPAKPRPGWRQRISGWRQRSYAFFAQYGRPRLQECLWSSVQFCVLRNTDAALQQVSDVAKASQRAFVYFNKPILRPFRKALATGGSPNSFLTADDQKTQLLDGLRDDLLCPRPGREPDQAAQSSARLWIVPAVAARSPTRCA